MRRIPINRLKKYILFAVLVITIFCGCGKSKDIIVQTATNPMEVVDLLSVNWKAAPKEASEVPGWEVTKYVPNVAMPANEQSSLWMDRVIVDNDKMYSLLLNEIETSEGYGCEYELKYVDLKDMSIVSMWSNLSAMDFGTFMDTEYVKSLDDGILTGRVQISSFDVRNDLFVMLVCTCDDDGNLEHVYRVSFQENGKVNDLSDYIQYFTGGNLKSGFRLPEIISGPDESFLLVDTNNDLILLTDKSSNKKFTVDFDINVHCIGKNPNGIPILLTDHGKEQVEFFYIDQTGKHVLFEGKMAIGVCSLDNYGNLLMLNGSTLFSWNIASGKMSSLYVFSGLSAFSCMGIAQSTSGKISAYFIENFDTFLYQLDNDAHLERKELILLQDLYYPYLEYCAADYSRTHPGVTIKLEQLESNDDFSKNLLLGKIKKGEGPDLIYTDRKQLVNLQAAGAICPLDKIVSSDTLDNIFNGVLDFGRIQSELYALPTEASPRMLMVNKNNWDSNSWTQEDIIQVFTEWKRNTTGTHFVSLGFNLSPHKLFSILFSTEIEHSEYVDLKNLTCSFQTPAFYDLLDFCKTYADKELGNLYSTDECLSQVLKEDAFSYLFSGGLVDYSSARSRLGDEYHTVGFPSVDGLECTIECYRGIAINSLSDNIDIAADFLQYVVSDEYQSKYTTSWIRKDTLKNRVKNGWEVYHHDKDDNSPVFMVDKHAYVLLVGREDGASYVDEYIEIMEKGVPESIEYEIQDILLEETAPFFEDAKTAADVAAIIQSRVQILLDERK